MENSWIFLGLSGTGFLQFFETREKEKGSEGCHCSPELMTELNWGAGQVSRSESWGSCAGGSRQTATSCQSVQHGWAVSSRRQESAPICYWLQGAELRSKPSILKHARERQTPGALKQNFQVAKCSCDKREPGPGWHTLSVLFLSPQRISEGF